MNEIEAITILSSTPLLGSVKIQALIRQFGSPSAALEAPPSELAALGGFTPRVIQKWGWWKEDASWERNLDLASRLGVEVIPYTSPRYPKPLLKIPDHPVVLYVQGEWQPSDFHSLAVVGTRDACDYGLQMAETLAHDQAALGYTIISGLARGIDTMAHTGALTKGRTIAVLGSGLAHIYPPENGTLAKSIVARGALISEYPMTAPPDRQNFPQRNRIVSGLSMGVLLVEAPQKSGAMLTMEAAFKQGKRLFALPGRVEERYAGNHSLIKNGKAQLVESAADIHDTLSNLLSFSSEHPSLTEEPNGELALGCDGGHGSCEKPRTFFYYNY